MHRRAKTLSTDIFSTSQFFKPISYEKRLDELLITIKRKDASERVLSRDYPRMDGSIPREMRTRYKTLQYGIKQDEKKITKMSRELQLRAPELFEVAVRQRGYGWLRVDIAGEKIQEQSPVSFT